MNENSPFPAASPAAATAAAGPSWWGLIGVLVVFLIILYISLRIIRKLNRASVRSMDTPWARVLDRQTLGGQQFLYLVEIAGQLQVLGGSEHYLSKLTEINDPALAAEILEEIATRPTERVDSWLMLVQKLFSRKTRKNEFSRELEQYLEEGEK